MEEAVDLSDVTSIDKTGWCVLRQMHRYGVTFSAKGLAGQAILDELAGKNDLNAKKKNFDEYFVSDGNWPLG